MTQLHLDILIKHWFISCGRQDYVLLEIKLSYISRATPDNNKTTRRLDRTRMRFIYGFKCDFYVYLFGTNRCAEMLLLLNLLQMGVPGINNGEHDLK